MMYSHEVERMCPIAKGPKHGPAPIPEEGKWVQAKEITDISAYTHGVGWCAPQQGACKLSLNVKNGIIEDAIVYLEHIPEGYVSGKNELINDLRERKKNLFAEKKGELNGT